MGALPPPKKNAKIFSYIYLRNKMRKYFHTYIFGQKCLVPPSKLAEVIRHYAYATHCTVYMKYTHEIWAV